MDNARIIEDIEKLRGRMLFSDIDIHFARFVCAQSGNPDCHPLFLAAALVSNATVGRKHVGFDLASVAGNLNDYFRDLTGYDRETAIMLRTHAERVPIPDPESWMAALADTPVVAKPGGYAPLILDGQFLYLHRFWSYEQQLGLRLRQLLTRREESADAETLSGRLLSVSPRFAAFARKNPGQLNWQAVAAFAAVRNSFSVITGGPGTGKTTVVAAILALLREGRPQLKIALCAPTGKAQARLKPAVREEGARLDTPPDVKEALIGMETYTIHRLLRVKYMTPHFRHDAQHPLDIDVLVVDEASMVPLILMTKLLAAIPLKTKVILLGDKDQLASVESGAVLNDLCGIAGINTFSAAFIDAFRRAGGDLSAAEKLPLAADGARFIDCAVALQLNYRFAPDKGIGRIKNAINELPENPSESLCRAILPLLENDPSGEVSPVDLPAFNDGSLDRRIAATLRRPLSDGETFESYLQAGDVDDAYRIFNRLKILCSHHVGMYGVENINRLTEIAMGLPPGERLYHGRPVIIRENQHHLRLYNGDIGLLWKDAVSGKLRAFFPDYEQDGGFRQFNPLQLPRHETVFAMTVHQAQGSGFENIVMILPDDENSPILTRELIYTGITRAMKRAEIWFKPGALVKALQRRTVRVGGLARLLTVE